MPHDVFISYSSHDRAVADAIGERLEASGVRCWIAPRDILPGDTYGGAIIRAISEAAIMLLVFSERANTSPQILREVERAVARNVAVLPVRIDDAKPADELEYFISAHHWLDALPPPPERHLDRIAEVVQRAVAARRARSNPPPTDTQPSGGETRAAVIQPPAGATPSPATQPPFASEPRGETPDDPEPAHGKHALRPPPGAAPPRAVLAGRAPTPAPPHWSEMSSLKARLLIYPAVATIMMIALVIWLQARASWEARNARNASPDTSAVAAPWDTTMAPTASPGGASRVAPSAATSGFLDPNSASREELMSVPGITPELADAVVAGRPYGDMRGVNRVLAGLGDSERDSVYTRLWKPLDLNGATAEEIELIPGVGPRLRREFEEYRPYKTIEQFRREIGKYVDDAEVARLERYVTLGF